MAYGEKYNAIWKDHENVDQVVTSAGMVGATPPTLSASAGKFTLDFASAGLNVGRAINFGVIKNAANTQEYEVSFRMAGAVASTIDFVTGTAAQITGTTNNSDGSYTITCTLNSGYDHPEFTIYSTDATQALVTFYAVRISAGIHEIKLLQDGYASTSTEIEKKQPIPLQVVRRGDKNLQINSHIIGKEIQFNFFMDSANIAGIDAIFESEFREWKVEHYYNDTLQDVGWLLPENFSRAWIPDGDYYSYTLSATDGLARLKEIEYTNFSTGAQYTDRVSIITAIKRALEHVDISLDFLVQLGTNCTNDSLMASTDCALDKVTHDSRRFTKDEDGREVNEDCYTIIEKLLAPFNCYLMQADGYYWILNPQEKDSYYFPIPWSTLTVGSRTANDLSVSLTDYKYRRGSELQKIRPIEQVGITFNDRNIADNLLSNGDFSSGTTGWNKSGYFGSLTASSGYGEVPAVYSLDTLPTYIYTDNESITQNNTDDRLSVTFKARITSYVGNTDYQPLMKVELYQGANFVPTQSNNIFPMYESSLFTTFTVLFDLPVTAADYQLRVSTYPRSTGNYTSFNFEVDDFVWVPIYADGEDLTFDRFYKLINTDSIFTDVLEGDLFFGDSQQDNDIGSFQISDTRTETWDRFGKSEDENLQVLYGQNLIENFAAYKNYLRVQIFDPKHNISAFSLLTEGSDDYQQISVEEIYAGGQRRELVCELIQVLNVAVTTSVSTQQLTSVDGKSSTPSSTQLPPSSSTPSLQEVTDVGDTTTDTIQVGGLKIGASKWELVLNGNNLDFKYNGTVVAKMTTAGYFSTKDDQEIFDTGL